MPTPKEMALDLNADQIAGMLFGLEYPIAADYLINAWEELHLGFFPYINQGVIDRRNNLILE